LNQPSFKRSSGRRANEIRPLKITRNYTKFAEGSVLVEMGQTRVLCTASVEEKVPPHKKNTGSGWITAEYSMLPRATQQRSQRESLGRPKGRTQEIQRLIGRSLRSVIDLDLLGERQIIIDCDVIQADGGTRTAAINGGFIALIDALSKLKGDNKIKKDPLLEYLAAVSVGVVAGKKVLDLDYAEDVEAEVDMNVVMTESGKFVEVQGTAEGIPFSRKTMDDMLDLAQEGILELIKKQKEALK
jgi:ribonuclease PH